MTGLEIMGAAIAAIIITAQFVVLRMAKEALAEQERIAANG